MTTNDDLTHLDLFTGIGGFMLAARACGVRTIACCETDPFCCQVLARNFPDVPNLGDIRQLCRRVEDCDYDEETGEAWCPRCDLEFSECACVGADRFLDDYGSPWLVTGGFPCQPFSLAGKRGGASDDRHLWPEMLRVVAETGPDWVLGENVPGITAMELDHILSDLEAIGYPSWPLAIPACAVDARHRRERIWIVGHANRERRQELGLPPGQGWQADTQTQRSGQAVADADVKGLAQRQGERGNQDQEQPPAQRSSPFPADPDCAGQTPGRGHRRMGRQRESVTDPGDDACCHWLPEPELGRVAHGIPRRVDRLRALGNAIVPEVATEIIRMMVSQP